MPKSFRTFLEDCKREIPNEVVQVNRDVDPANYDVTAIIKHLGAQKKFPMLVVYFSNAAIWSGRSRESAYPDRRHN